MKRFITLFIAIIAMAVSAQAQDFPYSKILKYSTSDFTKERFKFDEKHNQWILRKSHGLQATLNVISALTLADADIRPDSRDYVITVQMGENDLIAYINVLFFEDSTYHKLLTFAKDNGVNLLETDSGKIRAHQFNYNDYSMLLEMKHINITATTTHTNTAAVKSQDESYNAYQFRISTGVEPTSRYLQRQADKKAVRDAKGKKKNTVEDMM